MDPSCPNLYVAMVSDATRFPPAVDTVVVGAGTAGAVVAGRLAAGSSGRTLLLEAGPDYGPADSGRWPRDLIDATSCAQWSHDWGYTGEYDGQVIHFNRARVVGGCSAHNAGAVVFGSRSDYDGWAAAGNPGWSARELLPLFASAWERLPGAARGSRRADAVPARLPGGDRGERDPRGAGLQQPRSERRRRSVPCQHRRHEQG
jgi:choline dehydrogenase-like flavoprotein